MDQCELCSMLKMLISGTGVYMYIIELEELTIEVLEGLEKHHFIQLSCLVILTFH